MYPVSDAYRAAVSGSHTITVRAEVWSGSTFITSLDVLDGTIDIDARRAIRRTLTMTVPASSAIVPSADDDPLTPYGNEIRVWRGVRARLYGFYDLTYDEILAAYPTYSVLASTFSTYGGVDQFLDQYVNEEIPLGVFIITNVEVTDDGETPTVTITGSDRSLRIQRARWTNPFTVASLSTESSIQLVLTGRWSGVTYASFPTGTTVPKATFGLDSQNDPWYDAVSLAQAAGCDLYFSGDGIATLAAIPDYASSPPSLTYTEGVDAVVLDVRRTITNEDTYNGVIVTGEGSATTVVRGEAWDEDPTSPTYRYGNFGQVPIFFSSSIIASATQAANTARRVLNKITGLVEQIEWTSITDPSLDVGDVIALVNSTTKVSRVLVIDRLSMPLTAEGSMSAVARTIRTGTT